MSNWKGQRERGVQMPSGRSDRRKEWRFGLLGAGSPGKVNKDVCWGGGEYWERGLQAPGLFLQTRLRASLLSWWWRWRVKGEAFPQGS